MRSDRQTRAPLGLKLAAAGGLLFLHLPILLIFVYAFTTEDKSYQWPPPGLTVKWLGVTWKPSPSVSRSPCRTITCAPAWARSATWATC